MNKVIKGKRYDTEKATAVAYRMREYSNRGWQELYRKRTGEYFMAHWSAENDPSVGWIEPLTYEEAKDFAEKHLDADEFEAEFGEVEDTEKGSTHLSLPNDVLLKLSNLAAKYGKTKGEIVTALIRKVE